SGTTRLTTSNNLSSPTFNAITISGTGYTLNGNPLTLGSPSVSGSGTITVNPGAMNETIGLDVKLAGPGGSRQFVTVGTGADLTIGGHLSGTTGSELTKEGTGTLTLANDNSAFTGPITVDQNAGTLAISNAN